jgi:hypothetical protein
MNKLIILDIKKHNLRPKPRVAKSSSARRFEGIIKDGNFAVPSKATLCR